MIVAVESGMNGDALAWISVDPCAWVPITFTSTLVTFGPKKTDDGTVA